MVISLLIRRPSCQDQVSAQPSRSERRPSSRWMQMLQGKVKSPVRCRLLTERSWTWTWWRMLTGHLIFTTRLRSPGSTSSPSGSEGKTSPTVPSTWWWVPTLQQRWGSSAFVTTNIWNPVKEPLTKELTFHSHSNKHSFIVYLKRSAVHELSFTLRIMLET